MRALKKRLRALRRARLHLHLSGGSVLCLAVIFLDYLWPYLGNYLPLSVLGFGVIGGLLSVAAILAKLLFKPNLSGDKDA